MSEVMNIVGDECRGDECQKIFWVTWPGRPNGAMDDVKEARRAAN